MAPARHLVARALQSAARAGIQRRSWDERRVAAVIITIIFGILLPILVGLILYWLGISLVKRFWKVLQPFGDRLGQRLSGQKPRPRQQTRPRPSREQQIRDMLSRGERCTDAGPARPSLDSSRSSPAYEEVETGPAMPPPAYGSWGSLRHGRSLTERHPNLVGGAAAAARFQQQQWVEMRESPLKPADEAPAPWYGRRRDQRQRRREQWYHEIKEQTTLASMTPGGLGWKFP
ncbi:hypothetical protein HIM_03018 [Hirsutella minnesotensis 3608]|nr:hypothetical protein HIM_03018 [Hirsutella minnesotensis 3608]